jgi:hypothetical protein
MQHTWCGIGYLLNLAFAMAYILMTKTIKQIVTSYSYNATEKHRHLYF